jgi:hypothetical protein
LRSLTKQKIERLSSYHGNGMIGIQMTSFVAIIGAAGLAGISIIR